MYNTKTKVSRGFHAHKELQQILVYVSGSCEVILDDGKERQVFNLNKPYQGLYVDKMIRHEMHNFSDDCVLLVLASDYCEEEDYLRECEEFLDYIQ